MCLRAEKYRGVFLATFELWPHPIPISSPSHPHLIPIPSPPHPHLILTPSSIQPRNTLASPSTESRPTLATSPVHPLRISISPQLIFTGAAPPAELHLQRGRHRRLNTTQFSCVARARICASKSQKKRGNLEIRPTCGVKAALGECRVT